MAVTAVVSKPADDGGQWRLYLHHDGTAELYYRAALGEPAMLRAGKAPLSRVRARMRELGLHEDGWAPA